MRQKVIATLGRLDVLQKTGQLDAVISSCSRYAKHTAVISAHKRGEIPPAQTTKIGPVLVFEKLWKELGIPEVLSSLLEDRKFEFPLERAIFITVLHGLFSPGSDRAAEAWYQNYSFEGAEDLQLHHFYRAMAEVG